MEDQAAAQARPLECHCCCCKDHRHMHAELAKESKAADSQASHPQAEEAQAETKASDAERMPKSRLGRLKTIKEDGIPTGKYNYVDDVDNEDAVEDRDSVELRFALIVGHDTGDLTEVRILSPYVNNAFQEKIKAYPKVTYSKNYIGMAAPYEPMYHYFADLQAYAKETPPADSAEEADFKALLLWYESDLKSGFDRIRATIAESNIRFDDLWAVFEPGEVVFTLDEKGQPQLGIVITTEVDSVSLRSETQTRKACYVEYWWVVWDRSIQAFTRNTREIKIWNYLGARQISSLPVYPLRYHEGSIIVNGQPVKLREHLERRGQKYKSMVSTKSACLNYEGYAEAVDPRHSTTVFSGRVVVDQDEGERVKSMFYTSPKADERTWVKPMAGSGKDDRYLHWDHFSPDKPFEPLQASLCPSVVYCLALETLAWYTIFIDNTSDVTWRGESFDHLVLEPTNKKMLKGLVEQHKRNKENVMNDVIQDKGTGLVVVLHGPPGVGKTLTAESVAEYTKKPLLSVNVGDIIEGDPNMSRRPQIEQIFKRASRWDAVLLIDEADVILEKRSLEDFRRNSLVAIFLRALEYYKGIIFITTNRLRTMDIAFQSRIQVAIKYNALVPEVRRQIWERFIDRLDPSETRAKSELRERLDDLQEWNLNGRQVRNVIMIAQALAFSTERRRGSLRYAHVEEVANKTIEFQDFFEEDANDRRSQLAKVSAPESNRSFRQTAPWR